jgi:DNA-binding LacI/PurR family transcriptional regulator
VSEHPSSGRGTEPEKYCTLLVESLDDEYEVQVLRGVTLGARDADVKILCVAGAAIDDADPDRRVRNFAFDLVNEKNSAQVLALCSAIGSALGPEALAAWLARYEGLPIYCLGVQVEGYPFLGVDNYGGTRALLRHLIDTHHAGRFAVIRGPQDSREAQDRYRAFEDALTDAGIEADPRLVLDGDYTKESGALAVTQLLDERRVLAVALDCIVAANDYMAMGAIAELQRRGVRVPEEVSVVGFDDVESARLARPSLTTVRQPADVVGRHAVSLLDRYSHGSLPPPEVLETELVVRRSCGCEEVDAGSLMGESDSPMQGVGASLVLRRQRILAELMRAGRGALGTVGQGWENRLLDALVEQIEGPTHDTLALAVDHMLRRWDPDTAGTSVVQDVLTALRREVLSCIANDPVARARVEAAVHEARVVASVGAAGVVESRLRREVELFDNFEHVAHRAMFGDPTKLASVLQRPLLALGMDACVVAALDELGNVDGGATVLLAVGSGPPRSGERTELWALPHHPVLHRMGRALVLLPICIDRQPAGAAIVAPNRIDGRVLEDLRAWFETLVHVARLRDTT